MERQRLVTAFSALLLLVHLLSVFARQELFTVDHWGNANPAFQQCSTGKYQSPINVQLSETRERRGVKEVATMEDHGLTPFLTRYAPSKAYLMNDGRALHILHDEGSTLTFEKQIYSLEKVMFHMPGEHTVDHDQPAVEIQFHHINVNHPKLRFAVSVRLMPGKENPTLRKIIHRFPDRVGETSTDIILNMANLLPDRDPNFYMYDGSFTAPPCAEGVRWAIMSQTMELSTVQMGMLYSKMEVKMNQRPIQALSRRTVLMSVIPIPELHDVADNPIAHRNGGPHQGFVKNEYGVVIYNWGSVDRVCLFNSELCDNGSALDVDLCTCVEYVDGVSQKKCPKFYTGTQCNECDPESVCPKNSVRRTSGIDCGCECQGYWEGEECRDCGLTCQNYGQLDIESCTCACDQAAYFDGDTCNTCPYTTNSPDTPCSKLGIFNAERCMCDCTSLFVSGKGCTECTLIDDKEFDYDGNFECPNQSTLMDPSRSGGSCGCHCNPQSPASPYSTTYWIGQFCEECKDKLTTIPSSTTLWFYDRELCTVFEFGTVPKTSGDVCARGSVQGEDDISCWNCLFPWTGPTCNECIVEAFNLKCEHGSTLNKDLCRCVANKPSNVDNFWITAAPNTVYSELSRFRGGLSNSKQSKYFCPVPWTGLLCHECIWKEGTDCPHGGVMSASACQCSGCDFPWAGRFCNECELNCGLGKLVTDGVSCSCDCPYPYTGEKCQDCVSDFKCLNGGTKPDEGCRCLCPEGLTGRHCELWVPLTCKNGGEDNQQGVCVNCDPGWAGQTCEECERHSSECPNGVDMVTCTCKGQCMIDSDQCANGGWFVQERCACQCLPGYGGIRCEVCTRECARGTLHMSTCTCECPVDGRFTGLLCEECGLQNEECKNEGAVDSINGNCECACAKGWSGPTCEVCVMRDCNGGTLDQTNCQCTKCPGKSESAPYQNCPNDPAMQPGDCAGPDKGYFNPKTKECTCVNGYVSNAKCVTYAPARTCSSFFAFDQTGVRQELLEDKGYVFHRSSSYNTALDELEDVILVKGAGMSRGVKSVYVKTKDSLLTFKATDAKIPDVSIKPTEGQQYDVNLTMETKRMETPKKDLTIHRAGDAVYRVTSETEGGWTLDIEWDVHNKFFILSMKAQDLYPNRESAKALCVSGDLRKPWPVTITIDDTSGSLTYSYDPEIGQDSGTVNSCKETELVQEIRACCNKITLQSLKESCFTEICTQGLGTGSCERISGVYERFLERKAFEDSLRSQHEITLLTQKVWSKAWHPVGTLV